MTFQERLRYYRERAGYKSAKEFAEKLGMGYTTYVAYENKDREPRYEVLCNIARLLDVTPNDLLGFTEKDELQRYIDLCNDSGIKARQVTSKDGSRVQLIIARINNTKSMVMEISVQEFITTIKKALASTDYKEEKAEIENFLKSLLNHTINKFMIKLILADMRKDANKEEIEKITSLENALDHSSEQ